MKSSKTWAPFPQKKGVAPEAVILSLHQQLETATATDSELRAELTEMHEKLEKLRKYINTMVVKDESVCNCFPCIEGRRLLEETSD